MSDTYPDSWWTGVNPLILLLDPGDNSAPVRLQHVSGRLLIATALRTRTAIASGSGAVSVSTPLSGWLDLSLYESAIIYGINNDPVTDITVQLDTSQTSVADSQPWIIPCPAGQQFRFELDLIRSLLTNFRLSAFSADLSAVNVSWAFVGSLR